MHSDKGVRPPTLIPDIVILDPGPGTFSDSDSLGYDTEAKYKQMKTA